MNRSRLSFVAGFSIAAFLIAGCSSIASDPQVTEASATSQEYPLLTSEDLQTISTQVCPYAEVLPVDLEGLQMSRDIAESFGETNYYNEPFKNLSKNAQQWDLLFRVLSGLRISESFRSTLEIAEIANTETVALATEFLTSWERDSTEASGAQEMIDLIGAQGRVAQAQMEVNAICFDIAVLGTSSTAEEDSDTDAQSDTDTPQLTANDLKKQRIARVESLIADCEFSGFIGGSNAVLQIDFLADEPDEVMDCVKGAIDGAGIPFQQLDGLKALTIAMASIVP